MQTLLFSITRGYSLLNPVIRHKDLISLILNQYLSLIREIKSDVTWSYIKRQAAKMKLLPSVFSSLNSRVKIFVFVANSRRHFFYFYVI